MFDLQRRRLMGYAVATTAASSFGFPAIVRGQAGLTLRMSSSLTADKNSSHFLWYEHFASTLKSRVGDKLSVAYFPNNQLGKESDVVQQVKLGAVDMMISGTSIWSTAVSEIGVLDLGYLFKSYEHVGKALDGAAGEGITKLMRDRANVVPLGYAFSMGARNVYTKNPLKSASELKGVKVRVLPVPNFVSTLKLMGAVATPIPFGEIYTALQTGVVDGLEQDAPTVLAGKFYEVAKHCTLTQHIYNPVMPVISTRALGKLDKDMQQAVNDAARAATLHQRKLAATTETAAFEELKKLGVTVTSIDRAPLAAEVSGKLWPEFTNQQPATKALIDAIQKSA